MIVFFNGDYLPKEGVRFAPNDRGLQFADGVYEVVRSYDGLLFRLDEHLARLTRSLEALRITSKLLPELAAICRNLLERNGLRDGLIYIQVTRGVAPRTHHFPGGALSPTHYVEVSPLHDDEEDPEAGVSVILTGDTRWARCDIKSLALLPNVLAAEEAHERGAREALFVRDGMVIEGSRSNYAGVRDGVVVTPPESNYMLSGVSRGVVLELCGELGIPVALRAVPQRELFTFDEVFLIGTSAEVLPVVSVDGRTIGNGHPGPVAHRLGAAFRAKVESCRS